MTPESAAFLDKAREAKGMLAAGWPDEAGRAAYLAGLHAAQALIFERTGKIVRRHRGVQYEFGVQTRAEPGFDADLRAFLGRTYILKATADYATGADAVIAPVEAGDAIATAARFVEAVAGLLSQRP